MIDKRIFKSYPIDEEDPIWDKLTRLSFTAKTQLPKDVLCFLEKGTVRKFHIYRGSELPEQISTDFYLTGSLFATAKHESPLEVHYETIDKGTLWHIDLDTVNEMFADLQNCQTAQKLFMEEMIRKKTLREIQLLKSSPEDMYLSLLCHQPEFIQTIPLKYLASYIGITPQALSRIRRRIS